MKKILLSIFLISWCHHSLFSQQDTTSLQPVQVKSKLEIDTKKSTSPIVLINQKEINRDNNVLLTPILNRVPGVYMQQGNFNTNRITIRGIGARSQFSTDRLKVYVDNIPITFGNGESIFEDIDLENLAELKIIKGPNATTYGSGLGGVLQLKHKQAITDGNQAKINYTQGSFGLQRFNALANIQDGNTNYLVSYANMQLDGFRQNSEYERESLNFKATVVSDQKTNINFLGIYTRLKAFIPSSISPSDFQNNPEIAPSNWLESQGFEAYDRFTLGANLNHQFSDNLSNSTAVFANFRDSYEPRPFDILTEANFSFGMRSVFEVKAKLFNRNLKLQAGTEFMKEFYSTATFVNLYQDFPNQGSVSGDLLTNFDQERFYIDFFVDANYEINEKWYFDAGLAVNATQYQLIDLFLNDGIDTSGNFSYGTQFLPKAGVSYLLNSDQSIQVSISKGFSVPTVAESLTEDGLFNSDLQPEKGWNYELAWKSNWLNNKLSTEVNIYRMDVSNLIVAERVEEDRFVGRNAGETRHDGIEVILKSYLPISSNIYLEPYFSGSFNFFTFRDFVDGEEDFSGNELTGIPGQQVNLGLDAVIFNNLRLFSNWNYVGSTPVNDANSLYAPSYQLINLKLDYQWFIHAKLKALFSLGVNNLLDENYVASVLPNAVGFGGAEPRFFYPGLPRNYFGSISLVYDF